MKHAVQLNHPVNPDSTVSILCDAAYVCEMAHCRSACIAIDRWVLAEYFDDDGLYEGPRFVYFSANEETSFFVDRNPVHLVSTLNYFWTPLYVAPSDAVTKEVIAILGVAFESIIGSDAACISMAIELYFQYCCYDARRRQLNVAGFAMKAIGLPFTEAMVANDMSPHVTNAHVSFA